MHVLVTGGTGFIGSHTAVELLNEGHEVTIVDSLVNSDSSVIDAVEAITHKNVTFHKIDVRDTDALQKIFQTAHFDAVIHFAALKAVGESVEKPLLYYRNNIDGLLTVLEVMQGAGVTKLLFSSSATVYGDPDSLPITEEAPLKPATNPYGATKQMAEQIITDVAVNGDVQAVLLRYFNPIGAHESGKIGELPKGTPNNLVPFITQAAAGVRDKLTVFGDDYDTTDGSGVRDYIHVVDLAKAHVKAIEYLNKPQENVTAINVGTGSGNSVLELIKTFEKVTGVAVPYIVGERRAGDIASCYASADKAKELLGWQAEKSIEDALRDAWNWQQQLKQ